MVIIFLVRSIFVTKVKVIKNIILAVKHVIKLQVLVTGQGYA